MEYEGERREDRSATGRGLEREERCERICRPRAEGHATEGARAEKSAKTEERRDRRRGRERSARETAGTRPRRAPGRQGKGGEQKGEKTETVRRRGGEGSAESGRGAAHGRDERGNEGRTNDGHRQR